MTKTPEAKTQAVQRCGALWGTDRGDMGYSLVDTPTFTIE